ncbi:GNAT family N-acetyltransferase [Microvirga puerhi]|uniref:N-acetyltransferase n=1 Tax=Microvirga puerhi TaxID=2876078 RepID=A0ABS7VM04_9HYPH|nr:N-acetyltransferase [Microvirga puerhi]MBZ6076556.1 N-acetyltransferase [Microvirga puerhi]
MTADLRIRPEELNDRTAIHALHAAAFGGPAEANLVDGLRRDGDLALSLVAFADEVIGHVAFSPLILAESPDVRAYALAPVAVLPAFQNQGVGAALIEDALQRLADQGADLILVLGEPNYYGDFGFRPEDAQGLRTPYDGPFLQALPLTDKGRDAQGPVAYASAFAELT